MIPARRMPCPARIDVTGEAPDLAGMGASLRTGRTYPDRTAGNRGRAGRRRWRQCVCGAACRCHLSGRPSDPAKNSGTPRFEGLPRRARSGRTPPLFFSGGTGAVPGDADTPCRWRPRRGDPAGGRRLAPFSRAADWGDPLLASGLTTDPKPGGLTFSVCRTLVTSNVGWRRSASRWPAPRSPSSTTRNGRLCA